MTQKQAELDALVAHITTPPNVVLEIGVDQGRSFHHWETCWPTATLIGIDLDGATWSSGPVINDPRIIHGDSHDPATLQQVKDRLAAAKVDFLFIDGDHSFDGVAQDYWNYGRLVRRGGGTIALHDICPHPAATGVHVHDFWTRIKHRGTTSEIIHPPVDWGGIGAITR